MTAPASQCRAILVLGMHRSGTSAVTRVLNLLGVALGDRLLPKAADNESGFWEHGGIVEVHDALLHALGRSWHDLRPLPDGWLHSDAAQAAKTKLAELIESDFAGVPLWAVKDPRLCRLLPLWRELLGELGIEPCALGVLRHPDEVARSLRDRDGFQLEQGRLLWLEHVADAERDSREWDRCIVAYDDLLSDWRPVMDRVGAELSIDWPVGPEHAAAAVDAFLDVGQRHHALSAAQVNQLPALIRDVYDAMRAVVRGEGSWEGITSATSRYHSMADVFARGYEADFQRSHAEAMEQLAAIEDDARQRSEAMLVTLREMNIDAGMQIEAAGGGRLRNDNASLYWCEEASDTYDESRKVTSANSGSADGERLVFRLPELPRVTRLRIDPSVHPGRFDLIGLRIDQVLVANFAERVGHVSQLRLAGQGIGHVAMVAMDEDPHVEVNVADLTVDWRSGATVEIHVLRRELPRAGFDEIWQRVQGGIVAACTLLAEQGGNQLQSIENLEIRLQQQLQGLSVDLGRQAEAPAEAMSKQWDVQMQALESRLVERLEELLQRSGKGLAVQLERLGQQFGVHEQRLAELSGSLRLQLDSRLDAEAAVLEQRANESLMAIAEQLRTEEQASKSRLLNRVEELLRGLTALHAERLDKMNQSIERLHGRGDGHSVDLAELRRLLKTMDDDRRKTLLQRLRGSPRRD